MALIGFHVVQVMMTKPYKHSEDYIGSFSGNPFVVQCFQCWGNNYTTLRCNKHPDCTEPREIEQEWYQKKNIGDHLPAQKETFADGRIETNEEMWWCKSCVESWENAYEGYDYEEWSAMQSEKPIKVEILN